jgi:dTDP-4-amino-4,6-dideoxygalactose transaminase
VRIGLNSRLDTLQAAVLLAKLEVFEEELAARTELARRYDALLAGCAVLPELPGEGRSAWALYTIRHPARDRIKSALESKGISSMIYYPKPLHRQKAFAGQPGSDRPLPASERIAAEVLSLPIHPYLSHENQERIIAVVREAAKG